MTAVMLPHADYKIYEGAPHGLFVTDRERLNRDIAAFVTGDASLAEDTQAIDDAEGISAAQYPF